MFKTANDFITCVIAVQFMTNDFTEKFSTKQMLKATRTKCLNKMLGKFASNLLIFHIEKGKGTWTSAKTFSRRFKPCGSMGSFPFRLLFYKLKYWILIAARASPIFSFLTFWDSLNENKNRIYDIGPLSPSINFSRAKRKKRRKRTARARPVISPFSPSPHTMFRWGRKLYSVRDKKT